MIISCPEIQIILNELSAKGKRKISLMSLTKEKIFEYNIDYNELHLNTTPSDWEKSIDTLIKEYGLSKKAQEELPQFDDIKKAVVSAGLLMPEGIDVLINEIKSYLQPKKRMNRRKRVLIALDTNQLIDNLMSSYVEEEFSSKENLQMRNFLSYIISNWVLVERDAFLRNESSKGIVELNNKLKKLNFYLPEKIDRKARLAYSIYSELKTLEESYTQLESRIRGEEKYEIMKDKNLKDQAIINEYEEYKSSLKDVKFIYITSDDQSFALAKDRFESIKVKVPQEIPQKLHCNIENGAKLIYQLTLFLGTIRINSYNIQFKIYYKGKEHNDWENKRLEFLCFDKQFEKRISTLISTTRRLNET
ncbi:MAG: hypothetical protein ACTSUC_16185 [Promethearchaeota archaeon]